MGAVRQLTWPYCPVGRATRFGRDPSPGGLPTEARSPLRSWHLGMPGGREAQGWRYRRQLLSGALYGFYPSNAYLDETAYCYLGEDLAADPLASDDDDFFERRVVPFREAVAMALDDRITESVSKVRSSPPRSRWATGPDFPPDFP